MEIPEYAQKTRFSQNGDFYPCERDIARNLGKDYVVPTMKLYLYDFLQGFDCKFDLVASEPEAARWESFFLGRAVCDRLGITSEGREVRVVLSVGDDKFPAQAF